jgi:hypothetical protein
MHAPSKPIVEREDSKSLNLNASVSQASVNDANDDNALSEVKLEYPHTGPVISAPVPVPPQVDPTVLALSLVLTLSAANEKLAIQVILNIFRDFVWTWWSCQFRDYQAGVTDDADYDPRGQWMGQQIWGTLAIATGFIGLAMIYKIKHRPMPYKEAIIYGAGAATAIYTWDRGQTVCTAYGQNSLNLTLNDAGYFSSICTGGFEGPTQYIVITLGNMLIDHETKRKYLSNPLRFLGELSLSASIGAIPGGMWQIVYNASIISNVGTFDTSLAVAAAVATCNVVTTKINDRIISYFEDYIISRVRSALGSSQPRAPEVMPGTLFHHQRLPGQIQLAVRPNQIAPAPDEKKENPRFDNM